MRPPSLPKHGVAREILPGHLVLVHRLCVIRCHKFRPARPRGRLAVRSRKSPLPRSRRVPPPRASSLVTPVARRRQRLVSKRSKKPSAPPKPPRNLKVRTKPAYIVGNPKRNSRRKKKNHQPRQPPLTWEDCPFDNRICGRKRAGIDEKNNFPLILRDNDRQLSMR